MKTRSLRYVFYIVICAILAFGLFRVLPGRSASSYQQGKVKKIERAFSSNPQARITKLKVGQHLRQFNEEFDESDDWLRRLSLELENVASKPIVYLQVNLNFPETKSSGNMMSYPIDFGLRPGSRLLSENKPILLMPGDKLNLTVDQAYLKLARFRHPISQIRKLQVEIGYIIFNDKTAWAAGDFLRQDSNNPDYYVNVGLNPPQ